MLLMITALLLAQEKQKYNATNYLDLQWKQVATRMSDSWYASDEAKLVAENVLRYQSEIGGWPKNTGFHRPVNNEEVARIKSTGIGATFDNGATLTEMIFLTKVFTKIKDERYRQSFMKALDYIFKAQYPNGGWPQYYPYRKGRSVAYSSHITYNDNAMVNIMLFLRDIVHGKELYESMEISDEMKVKAKESFTKGIECILKTQIIVNGRRTVWCAQHDEFTLVPANARSYELASFSGLESVGITLLLMDIANPSKEIVNAIQGAVKWFEEKKIEGISLIPVMNQEGKKDLIVVEDRSARALWARFYDLETERPFFCDRDGVKKNMLEELGYNRRNGYTWYTDAPKKVLEKYSRWKQMYERTSNK